MVRRFEQRISEGGTFRLDKLMASWAKDPEERKQLLKFLGDKGESVTIRDIAEHLGLDVKGFAKTMRRWAPQQDPVRAIKAVLDEIQIREVENLNRDRPESLRQKQ